MRCHDSYRDNDINYHCAIDKCPEPSSFAMHTHDTCELYCFLSGQGVYRIEGSAYILEPGDILVMRPAETHCISPDPDFPYERMSIHFRESLLQTIDPEGLLLTPFYNHEPGRFNLYRDNDFPDQSHRFYINTMMRPCGNRRLQVLSNLPPLLNCLYQASQRRNAGLPSPEDTPIYRILRYINSNLTSNLTLDNLCEKFFTSKSQLCRSFKHATGASVGEYITVKRLINARSMLLEGMPPTTVCTASGFNDYSAFYRAYIKRFGKSPAKDHRNR